MAVIVKYVVVRDGKDDMIFSTKKEADAYDRMLDIAERLWAFLQTSQLAIDPDQLEALAFFMAQHGEQVSRLLRGGALGAPSDSMSATALTEEPEGLRETEATEAPKSARGLKARAIA